MTDVPVPSALLSCRRKFGSRLLCTTRAKFADFLLGRWADVQSLHPISSRPGYLRVLRASGMAHKGLEQPECTTTDVGVPGACPVGRRTQHNVSSLDTSSIVAKNLWSARA